MQKLARLTLSASLFLFLGAVGLVSCAPENREGVVETQQEEAKQDLERRRGEIE